MGFPATAGNPIHQKRRVPLCRRPVLKEQRHNPNTASKSAITAKKGFTSAGEPLPFIRFEKYNHRKDV
jgi:hypothetical protein